MEVHSDNTRRLNVSVTHKKLPDRSLGVVFNSDTPGASVGTRLPQMPTGVRKHQALSI